MSENGSEQQAGTNNTTSGEPSLQSAIITVVGVVYLIAITIFFIRLYEGMELIVR